MKIKEILSLAATLAAKDDVATAFSNGTADKTDKTVAKFYTAYDLVISELSEEIEPLVTSETIVSDGRISFGDFTEKVKEILKVERDGREIPFSVEIDGVKTEAGEVTITYDYLAARADNGNDECPYPDRVFSMRVLAKAVAAEYLLTVGLFEEAVVLRRAFEAAVTSYALSKKRKAVRKRTWA